MQQLATSLFINFSVFLFFSDPDQYERAVREQERRARGIIQGMSAGLCKGLIRYPTVLASFPAFLCCTLSACVTCGCLLCNEISLLYLKFFYLMCRMLAWLMYWVAGYLYNRIDIQNRHVHMLKVAQEVGTSYNIL